jgi:hypothetical protein
MCTIRVRGAETRKEKKMDTKKILGEMHACDEAMEWFAKQDGSDYAKWRRCERGDWLIWLASELRLDVPWHLIGADIAETVLPIWEKSAHLVDEEHRDAPRKAIEAARAGDAKAAADTASIAAADTAYAAAYDAARAAAYAAAYAAYAAARAAARAAAYAAAYAAYAAARAAARAADTDAARGGGAPDAAQRKIQAKIVRRYVQWSVVRDALKVRLEA